MRTLFFLLASLQACSLATNKQPAATVKAEHTEIPQSTARNTLCWMGTINHKIPVLLHYTFGGDVLAGEIIYLNTKQRKPIKVIGTLEEDKSYRILEFQPNGNITGILTGTPSGKSFTGDWFSPKTRKEYQLNLTIKDTTLQPTSSEPMTSDMYGDYLYQYSDEGSQGSLNLSKLNGNTASFSIFSVTGSPGRNLAEVPLDTISINGNSFIYKIPGSDSCEFKVRFYKDFAKVYYTKGYCNGQFGWNATVDGIFLKVKGK